MEVIPCIVRTMLGNLKKKRLLKIMILCIQALKLCYMCLFRWCPSENKVSLNFQVLCLLFSPREGIWTKYLCCGGYYSFVPLNFSTFKPQINSLDKSFLLNTIKLSTLSSWQVAWFFFFFPILIVLSSFLCAYTWGEVFQCFGFFLPVWSFITDLGAFWPCTWNPVKKCST